MNLITFSSLVLLAVIALFFAFARNWVQRKRIEQRLRVQYAIARVLAETATLEEAAPNLLQEICETLHWDRGEIWLPNARTNVLEFVQSWQRSPNLGLTFERTSRKMTFAPGVGLIGQVWSTAEPIWIADVTQEQKFLRAELAVESGLHSALGFPIRSGTQLIGVMAFFNYRIRQPDDGLLQMMQTIGSQIGQFIKRKQSEVALRGQETLLRMALNAAHMGAWDWNIVTGKENWSSEVAEIFGFSADSCEVHYEDFLNRVHPDDRALLQEAQRRTLEEGVQYSAEYRIILDNGGIRWITSQGNVVRDVAGKPLLLTGVTMDITNRKQAEAALKQAEEKYRSIFENAADGIFQTTPEGVYISANPALASIYGYDSAEELMAVLSYRIEQQLYVDPHRRTEFVHLLNQHGSVQDFESQVYRRDGSIIWISENARVVQDNNGELLYYEGIVKDITDRKQAAEELFKAKDAAETASQAKSQFLANMSHELRTPLNAIIGYSEMLQEDSQDMGYDDIVPDLEKIRSAGQHLLSLINDILDISKIEAGKMDLYLETFNISSLITEVEATIQPLVEKNGNTLQVNCASDLSTMYADLTKVRQALLNLLSNASKFTDKGTLTLTINQVNGDSDPENGGSSLTPHIIFEVSDTGIGMSTAQMSKLFQAFTQADASTTRKYGGTGLGLIISRRFCQMMGGDISVISELGAGSTFTIRLPLTVSKPPVEALKPTAIANPPANSEEPAIKEATLLVIDDDSTVRELVRRYLEKDGFRVETAASGQEGLHMAKKLCPDAITLDVMMPTMDGWSVLSALKADPELADIPVIVLTIVDNKNLGFALGASEYLTKPIDYKRLTSVLNRYRLNTDAQKSLIAGRVLIAEDDPTTREMFHRILAKEGWSIVEAENGRAALQQVINRPPDLILLDLMMPEVDGFQFIAALRSQPEYRQIPVVVVTAQDITLADRLRLNGYVEQILQKGAYQCDQLLQEVRDLVFTCIRRRSRSKETVNG